MSDARRVTARAVRRTCGRIFLLVVTGTLLLTILLFLSMTTSLGLRVLVLPVAESLLGVSISFHKAAISPMLSRIDLEGLEVNQAGVFSLSVEFLHARIRPWLLWNGIIGIDELKARGVDIRVVSDEDIPEEQGPKGEDPEDFSLSWDVKHADISDADLVLEWKRQSPEPSRVLALQGISLSLVEWITGKVGVADFSVPRVTVSGETVVVSSGRAGGKIEALVASGFRADRVDLAVHADGIAGNIAEVAMKDREVDLRASAVREGTSYRIDTFQLQERCGNDVGASLSVQGAVTPYPLSLDLGIRIERLSSSVLDLVEEMLGISDLGGTSVQYSGSLSFSERLLKIRGTLFAQHTDRFPASRKTTVFLPASVSIQHDLVLDIQNKEAEILLLKGDILQRGRTVVELVLLNTARFSWKSGVERFFRTLPRFNLAIRGLQLDTVKTLFLSGSDVQSLRGLVDGSFNTNLDEARNILSVAGRCSISGFTLKMPGFSAENVDIRQDVDFRVEEFARIVVRALSAKVRQGDTLLGLLRIAGNMNLAKGTGTLQAGLEQVDSRVLSFFPQIAEGSRTTKEVMQELRDFDISCSTSAEYDLQANRIVLENLKGGLARDGKETVSISLEEPLVLAWAEGTGGLTHQERVVAEVDIEDETLTLVNAFLPASVDLRIQSGTILSKLVVEVERVGADYDIRCATQDTLRIRDLVVAGKGDAVSPQPFEIESRFHVLKTPDRLDFVSLSVSFSQGRREVADLHVAGNLVFQEKKAGAGKKPSLLQIRSNGMDWEALSTLLPRDRTASRGKGEGKAEDQEAACTGAMDLRGMDALVDLDLKNIRFGAKVSTDWETKVEIRESMIRIDPLKFLVNGTPFSCSVQMDASQPCGMRFEVRAETKDLDLGPILASLAQNTAQAARGRLRTFSMLADGTGFAHAQLDASLGGRLDAEIDDLVVPANLKGLPLFRLVFLPLDVLNSTFKAVQDPSAYLSLALRKIISPKKELLGLVSQSLRMAGSDTGKQQELRYDKAILHFEVQEGKIRLKECKFHGKKGDILSFKGWVGIGGRLNLIAELRIPTVTQDLILPLRIRGTVDKPVPDIETFVLRFIGTNAFNLINPIGWVKSVDKTIGFLVKIVLAPVNLIQGLLQPGPKDNESDMNGTKPTE